MVYKDRVKRKYRSK